MAHVYACKGQSFWGKAELLKAANKKCTIYSTVRQMIEKCSFVVTGVQPFHVQARDASKVLAAPR